MSILRRPYEHVSLYINSSSFFPRQRGCHHIFSFAFSYTDWRWEHLIWTGLRGTCARNALSLTHFDDRRHVAVEHVCRTLTQHIPFYVDGDNLAKCSTEEWCVDKLSHTIILLYKQVQQGVKTRWSCWQSSVLLWESQLRLWASESMHSMRSMRGGLFSAVEGPCKRYAMAPTRMSGYNCLPEGDHGVNKTRGSTGRCQCRNLHNQNRPGAPRFPSHLDYYSCPQTSRSPAVGEALGPASMRAFSAVRRRFSYR